MIAGNLTATPTHAEKYQMLEGRTPRKAVDILFMAAKSMFEADVLAEPVHRCAKAINRHRKSPVINVSNQTVARIELFELIRLEKIKTDDHVFSGIYANLNDRPDFMTPAKLLSTKGKTKECYYMEVGMEEYGEPTSITVQNSQSVVLPVLTGQVTTTPGLEITNTLKNLRMDLDDSNTVKKNKTPLPTAASLILKSFKENNKTIEVEEEKDEKMMIILTQIQSKLASVVETSAGLSNSMILVNQSISNFEQTVSQQIKKEVELSIPTIIQQSRNACATDVKRAGDLANTNARLIGEMEIDRIADVQSLTARIVALESKKHVSEETSDPIVEYNIYERGCTGYRNKVWANKRGGKFMCVLIEGAFSLNGTADVNRPRLTELLGCRFDIEGRPWTSGKGNVAFNGTFSGLDKGEKMFRFLTDLMNNRRTLMQSKVSITLVTPSDVKIDRVLKKWIEDEILVKSDLKKSGMYILFLRDGTLGYPSDGIVTKEYLDTCSRLNVQNPVLLSQLKHVSIEALKKVADRTHFPDSRGNLLKIPASVKIDRSHLLPGLQNRLGENADVNILPDQNQLRNNKTRDFAASIGVNLQNENANKSGDVDLGRSEYQSIIQEQTRFENNRQNLQQSHHQNPNQHQNLNQHQSQAQQPNSRPQQQPNQQNQLINQQVRESFANQHTAQPMHPYDNPQYDHYSSQKLGQSSQVNDHYDQYQSLNKEDQSFQRRPARNHQNY